MPKPKEYLSGAAKRVLLVLGEANVHLASVHDHATLGGFRDTHHVSLKVSRGWGIEATLHVRLVPRRAGNKTSRVETSLIVASGDRTIAQALGQAALLQELALLAATVEGVLGGFDIVPDPKARRLVLRPRERARG